MTLALVNNRWTDLHGTIAGPPDTPYEGGTFHLEIKLPRKYPFVPPKIRFITNIWHPNIDFITGNICLDILDDQWVAAYTLRTVLLSIQVLLSDAVPDDPLNLNVAKQSLKNHDLFTVTAKIWTNIFAGEPTVSVNYDRKRKKQVIVGMGIAKHEATEVLANCDWSLEEAIEQSLRKIMEMQEAYNIEFGRVYGSAAPAPSRRRRGSHFLDAATTPPPRRRRRTSVLYISDA